MWSRLVALEADKQATFSPSHVLAHSVHWLSVDFPYDVPRPRLAEIAPIAFGTPKLIHLHVVRWGPC